VHANDGARRIKKIVTDAVDAQDWTGERDTIREQR
jgi:hypothetical protein